MLLVRHALQTCICSLIVFNSFFVLYLMCCFGNNPLYMDFTPIKILFCSVLSGSKSVQVFFVFFLLFIHFYFSVGDWRSNYQERRVYIRSCHSSFWGYFFVHWSIRNNNFPWQSCFSSSKLYKEFFLGTFKTSLLQSLVTREAWRCQLGFQLESEDWNVN